MRSTQKVAIVTGANKGIGYAIVKGLCEKFEGDVILTSRDASRGQAAEKSLNELGLHPKLHLLDVDDPDSIRAFRKFIEETYQGIDVLVNNAAIALEEDPTKPLGRQARETIRTNYFGLLSVCDELFPLLRPHARVVNVTSSDGHLPKVKDKNLREKLASNSLTVQELNEIMKSFIKAAETGNQVEVDSSNKTYGFSKVGVSALSRIQQREFEKDGREDIIVNHVHPGYVATDMTEYKGPLTIEQGAEAPIYLALLPKNTTKPKGDYVWHDKSIVDWVNGPLPSLH